MDIQIIILLDEGYWSTDKSENWELKTAICFHSELLRINAQLGVYVCFTTWYASSLTWRVLGFIEDALVDSLKSNRVPNFVLLFYLIIASMSSLHRIA